MFNLNRYLPWVEGSPEIVRYPTGCSINAIAEFALQPFFPESRGPYFEVFHAECVRHDLCYRHGYYTYQFSKEYCDDEFAEGLEHRCMRVFQGQKQTRCRRVADILILAARKFGHLSYHSARYPFLDYSYYYEYLEHRAGQYALFWSLLNTKSEQARELYRRKVNYNLPLPSAQFTRRLLEEFFKKRIGLDQLISQLKILPAQHPEIAMGHR